MKTYFSILILISFALFSFRFDNTNCDNIPELNNEIIAAVKGKLNTKVARGECWDLADYALKKTNAKWKGGYEFGQKVNIKTDCIYPGDIIQFERVKLKYEKNGASYVETMSHHTAIIYEVKDKENFILAHQNTGHSGKKVGLSPINLDDMTKGKFTIYRPVK